MNFLKFSNDEIPTNFQTKFQNFPKFPKSKKISQILAAFCENFAKITRFNLSRSSIREFATRRKAEPSEICKQSRANFTKQGKSKIAEQSTAHRTKSGAKCRAKQSEMVPSFKRRFRLSAGTCQGIAKRDTVAMKATQPRKYRNAKRRAKPKSRAQRRQAKIRRAKAKILPSKSCRKMPCHKSTA